MKFAWVGLLGALLGPASLLANDDAVSTLRAAPKVSPAAAQKAVRSLADGNTDTLLKILNGFTDADPIAANWLRAAFETSLSKRIREDRGVPADRFARFVKDTSRDGRARRLAYDWMYKHDPTVADTIIPGMLLDSVPEFRRDAVALLIEQGREELADGRKDAARRTFRRALQGAIHRDQVKQIVKPLRGMGEQVSIQHHFGFLPSWSIVGPFDNSAGKGFATAYPPEKDLKLNGEFTGRQGKTRWAAYSTDNDYGSMNIAKEVRNYKGSCMYATTTFVSDREQTVELRLSTPNAWKLWVNGRFVFGHDEYHRTPAELPMDQYRVPVKLRRGENRILMKVCQNEQDQDWAQRYEFQLRVSDATGSAVRPATARVAE